MISHKKMFISIILCILVPLYFATYGITHVVNSAML